MFNPSPKFKRPARSAAGRLRLPLCLALPCLALLAAAPASTIAKVAPVPTSTITKVGPVPTSTTAKVAPAPTSTTANVTPAPTGTIANVGTAPINATTNIPPQGMYEECAPSAQQQCAGELAQMGTAGFRLALNYTAWFGSAADIQAYASAAQAQGIKLIWPLNALPWHSDDSLAAAYPLLAASCACTTNDAMRQYAINLVRPLPATWGYYIGDEEASSAALAVTALARTVRGLDPSHQLLYVGQSYPSVAATVTPFLSAADVIGADVYPIGEGAPVSVVGDVAAKVAQIASSAGKRGAMVLQAFSWTQYPTEIAAVNPRWPTEAELHGMLTAAAAANPSMILWYNLSDIQRSDNPAQHWQDLVTAAFGKSPTAITTTSPPAGGTPPAITAPTTTAPTTTKPSSTSSSSGSSTSSTSSSGSTPASSPKTSALHGTGPAGKTSHKPKPAKPSKRKPATALKPKPDARPKPKPAARPKPKAAKRAKAKTAKRAKAKTAKRAKAKQVRRPVRHAAHVSHRKP